MTTLARPFRALGSTRSSANGGVPPLTLVTAGSAVVFLSIFGVLLHSSASQSFTRDFLNTVPATIALLLAIQPVRHSVGRERTGWLCLVFMIATWECGDLTSSFYTFVLDRDVPFPSVADILYIPGYVGFAVGILLVTSTRWRWPEPRALVDAVAVLFAIVALVWPFLLAPALSQDLSTFDLSIAVAYPVLDLIVGVALVLSFYASEERSSLRFLTFAMAICASTLADSNYAAQITTSGDYQATLDILFVSVYWFLAIAFTMPAHDMGLVSRLGGPTARSIVGVYLPRLLTVPLLACAILDFPGRAQGSLIIDLAAVGVVLLLVLRQAITGRENVALFRRVQRDSNERAALLRALGDIGEAFMIIENGRIVSANHALWMLVGYSEAEVLAMDSADVLVAERDRGRITSMLTRALSSGTVVSGAEISALTREGLEVPVELATMPLTLDGRAQVLVVARDITERKQSQRALLESQKLEGLRVLAGGVAHDFNNLLQVIRGNAHLALLEAGDTSPAAPYLSDIDVASDRAAGLARQMLIYAGKAEPVVETVNPGRVVEEMALLLRASVHDGIELDVDSARDVHSLMVDASQLRQVVMNLVVNASEAIGPNTGRIRVVTTTRYLSARELTSAHAAAEVPPGHFVVIEVSDSGPGMSEEVRRRIFDPFYTTKFTGRGLGLAAVLGIVRSHGGAIIVDSEPGRGATFRVILPIESQSALAVS